MSGMENAQFTFTHDAPESLQRKVVSEAVVAMMRTQRDTSDKKIVELEAQIEKLQAEHKEKVAELEAEFKELQAVVDPGAEIEKLKETLADVEDQWEICDEEINMLEGKLAEAGKDMEKSQEKLKKAEEERGKWQEKLATVKRDRDNWKKKYETLEEENSTAADEDYRRLQNASAESEACLKTKLEDTNKEYAEANEKLSTLQKEMEVASEWKSRFEAAQQDAYELGGKVEALEEQVRNNDREIHGQKTQYENDQAALRNLEERLLKFEKSVKDRDNTIKRHLAEINVLRGEVKEKTQEIKAARNDADTVLKDKSSSEHNESALREQIALLQEQNEQLSGVHEENQRLATEVEVLDSQVKELAAQNQELEGLITVPAPSNEGFGDGEDDLNKTAPLSAHSGGLGFENLDQESSDSGSDEEISVAQSTKKSAKGKAKGSPQSLAETGPLQVANITPQVTPLVLTQTPVFRVASISPVEATLEVPILLGTGFSGPVEPQPLNETPRPPQQLADLATVDFARLGGRPAPPTETGRTEISSQIAIHPGDEDYVMIPTDVHRSFNPLRWWFTVYYELFWVPFARWLNVFLPESQQLPSRRLNLSGGRKATRPPVHLSNVAELFQMDDHDNPANPSGQYLEVFEAPSIRANVIMFLFHLAIYIVLWNAWGVLKERNLWLEANELTRQYIDGHRRVSLASVDNGLLGYWPLPFGFSLDGLRYSLHTWANIDRSFPG